MRSKNPHLDSLIRSRARILDLDLDLDLDRSEGRDCGNSYLTLQKVEMTRIRI